MTQSRGAVAALTPSGRSNPWRTGSCPPHSWSRTCTTRVQARSGRRSRALDRTSCPDTIKFPRWLTGTITLKKALPALSGHLVLSHPGTSSLTVARRSATGTPDFRIVTVPKRAVVKINGLTISHGSAREGGGIANAGTLSLVNTTLSYNSATGSSSYGTSQGSGYGGGIENSGKLSVNDCTLKYNFATGLGSHYGYDGGGGGIANAGELSIVNSRSMEMK